MKLFLKLTFLLLLSIVAGTSSACDACGCSASGLSGGMFPQIHMAVDLSRFFNGTSDSLSVASKPMIHDPGAKAVKAAHRFQEAFEFEHLHQ